MRAEMRLQRVGVAEVFAAEHALVRERVVVDAPVALVVAVVGERRVAVGAAVGSFAGVDALVRLHALEMVERRTAQITEERSCRHAAQQVAPQPGILRERATAKRTGERMGRRVDRHVLLNVRQPVGPIVTAVMTACERTMDAVDQDRVSLESDWLQEIGRAFLTVENT